MGEEVKFPKKMTPERAAEIAARNAAAREAHPELSSDPVAALETLMKDAHDRAVSIMVETLDCDLRAAEQAARAWRRSMQLIDLAHNLLAIKKAEITGDPVAARGLALAFERRDEDEQ